MSVFLQESAIAAIADIWFGDIRHNSHGDTPRRSTSDTDSNLKVTARMIVATLRRYGETHGQIAEVIEQVGLVRKKCAAAERKPFYRSPRTRPCWKSMRNWWM